MQTLQSVKNDAFEINTETVTPHKKKIKPSRRPTFSKYEFARAEDTNEE